MGCHACNKKMRFIKLSASFIILYKHNLHKLPVTAGYEGAFTFSTLFPSEVLKYFQLGFIY